jgi:RNA polymerase I-specific transcription initiation factor RRN3
MVSLVPEARHFAPAAPKPSKPLLRRATASAGTVRTVDDAGLDLDFLSAPPSPSKRAKVSFNPNVEEVAFSPYNIQSRRSLESVKAEVKRAIESHIRGENEEGYDSIKEIFVPRKEDDEREGADQDMTAYLLALTSHASRLNRGCSGLIKAILACEWIGRDEKFLKAYVQFLGSLSSAHGAYVGLVLRMLVGHFYGGKTIYKGLTRTHLSYQ